MSMSDTTKPGHATFSVTPSGSVGAAALTQTCCDSFDCEYGKAPPPCGLVGGCAAPLRYSKLSSPLEIE
eukprot:4554957-Prymnesium_polylepis.1